MNKLLLLILAILISCKSPSQEGKSINVTNLEQSFSNKNEKEFLENFPKDFQTFKNTFGWNDEKDSAEILYKQATPYIDYWFSLIQKPQYKKYENSITEISKNGKWEADAVNYFKIKSIEYIKKNKKYDLINSLSKDDAKSVLTFLLDSPHSKPDDTLLANLTAEKQNLAKEILSANPSSETKRSSFETYVNNEDYFIKTFDVNKDGISDKIVSNKPYQGENLFVFLGDKQGKYILALETRNFSEDGGNIINDIIPISGNKGFTIKTSFPDRGYYEKEYNIVLENNTWLLKNIIYKTMSDTSQDAVKYICDVPQNIDIQKSGWTDKIIPIPEENVRAKKCRVEKSQNKTAFYIQDSDGFTNLRKEKNSSSQILQKINTGEQVEVLDQNGDWWLVVSKEGKKGYVHKSRIKPE
ncbi:SH3 domain-containing protein [Chryseobacterium sp. RRHN12]|uniref:SH3 domain-containing protein n=1 Tax=Chryseobacterium sp. RRHN12 TaxID=3437884 RepID=UPI003D9B8885